MSKNQNVNDNDILDPEEMFITIELEDGTEEEFQIITIFEVDGQDYIALIPCSGEEEFIFYRYFEDEEGNPSIDNIETDEEFEAVIDKFDEMMDDEEFEQM